MPSPKDLVSHARTLEAPTLKRSPAPHPGGTLPLGLGAGAISSSPAVDPARAAMDVEAPLSRYAVRSVLGEGGMGEVRLCRDAFIGRDVAMKVARGDSGSSSDARERFLREARVQGQLEHPSVVPVYDLGVSEGGEVYFTMKRVKGLSLYEIIFGVASGDPEAASSYPRRRLVSAMSQVCLTVAFAHARGVVHRDLKPPNIMLGDFGEVYVLDWGVAKVGGAADPEGEAPEVEPGDGAPRTALGTLLGTPGYMAPEQARGEVDRVDARTDVYALGAILFEILTLSPLHAGESIQALLSSAMLGAAGRPSERAPHAAIPPELDAICERATAMLPEDRFASAREMHDAIERYLEGEADIEKRRAMAAAHKAAANDAIEKASRGGPSEEAERARALRELSSALVFDPGDDEARTALVNVILAVPGELPPEAEAELLAVNRRDRADAAKLSGIAYATWALGFPLVIWMGVRSPGWLLFLGAVVTAMAAFSFWMGMTGRADPSRMRYGMVLAFVGAGALSMFFGPLFLVPGVAVAHLANFAISLRANALTRRALLVLSLGSFLVPLALQWVGLVPASYAFEGDALRILPVAVDFPPEATLLFLILSSVMTVVLSSILSGNAISALLSAERTQFAQAYRLRHLLPEGAAAPVSTERSLRP